MGLSTINSNRYDVMDSVFKVFGMLWLFTGIGLLIGQFLPPIICLPISILTVVILIATMFFKASKKMGIGISYLVATLIGITLNFSVSYYIGTLGNSVVIAVFGTTAIIFGITGFIGYKTKKDLMGWGNILFVSLITLFVFSLFSVFFPVGNLVVVLISGAGVLLFSLYNVYEMNMLAKGHVSEDEVGYAALNLYLNFINIFLDLLRLVGVLSSD